MLRHLPRGLTLTWLNRKFAPFNQYIHACNYNQNRLVTLINIFCSCNCPRFLHVSSDVSGGLRSEGSAERERERDCCSEEETGSTGKGMQDWFVTRDKNLSVAQICKLCLQKQVSLIFYPTQCSYSVHFLVSQGYITLANYAYCCQGQMSTFDSAVSTLL